MKKIMIVCAVVLAACFTSCNDDKAACWEVTITYTSGGEFIRTWGTAAEIDATMAELRQEYGDEIKSITKKKLSKSAGDCY